MTKLNEIQKIKEEIQTMQINNELGLLFDTNKKAVRIKNEIILIGKELGVSIRVSRYDNELVLKRIK